MEILENSLVLANQIVASFTVILAFSLLGFIFAYNRKSPVGRAFLVLLACLCVTYAGDVALFQVGSWNRAVLWLRFQWIGIAFMPAVYLHFSDALLRTTNDFSGIRRLANGGAYLLGGVFFYLALMTDLLVTAGFFSAGITQFQAGPLFWLFTVYFSAAVLWGFVNTLLARRRCLTSASKTRMTQLMVSFAAPALGVFPYMLLASQSQLIPSAALLATLMLLNLGVSFMIMLLAYAVSLFDAFAPDRVVKYRLATFFLRGPLVATLVIIVILALPDRAILLGLPREVILLALIVAIIVLAPLAANYLKPGASRLIYWREQDEVELLRAVDMRLVTTTDLRQALENVLTAICELLRVRTGFVANVAAQTGPRLETSVGLAEKVEAAMTTFDSTVLKGYNQTQEPPLFIPHGEFWYVPLQTADRESFLGLLGVEGRASEPNLKADEERTIKALIQKAELVLEDRRLQRNVFNTLRGIVTDLERSQRVRSAVRYIGSPIENLLIDDSPIHEPDFVKMVQEALSHYWGGPKLMNSPLLQLNVVQEAIEAHEGNTVNALRAVLRQAIESVRPNGERRMTTSEWLFYNILELKFIRGLKVRDIASRLAMSEADFYRKQKIAIEAVARSLSEMETRG